MVLTEADCRYCNIASCAGSRGVIGDGAVFTVVCLHEEAVRIPVEGRNEQDLRNLVIRSLCQQSE